MEGEVQHADLEYHAPDEVPVVGLEGVLVVFGGCEGAAETEGGNMGCGFLGWSGKLWRHDLTRIPRWAEKRLDTIYRCVGREG